MNTNTYSFDDVVLFARTGLNPRQNFKLGNGNNAYITIKNIHNNKLVIDEKTDLVNDEAIAIIHNRSQIQKGDVLFSSIGRLGDMYIIEEEPNGWDINESVFAFTLNTNIVLQKYFYYFFKHPSTIDHLAKNSSGSTFKSIKMNQLRKMTFAIPPLPVQEQIITVLETISKLIELKKLELEKMDQLIKSRFVELFGDLKANNKNWPIVKFTDIASIDTRMIHSFDGYENYPHIGIDSIEKNTGKLSGFRTVKEDGVISGKYLFDERHIIYSKIRPNLNKVALPTFSGVCSADAYPILPNVELCTREFLAYVMRSDLFLDYILAFSNRTNLPKVNKMQVEGFECPLPALEQQKVFVELINQIDKSKLAQVI